MPEIIEHGIDVTFERSLVKTFRLLCLTLSDTGVAFGWALSVLSDLNNIPKKLLSLPPYQVNVLDLLYYEELCVHCVFLVHV